MINFDSDEKIVMKVRKHWFVVFSEAIVMFFVLIAPLILLAFVGSSEFFKIKGEVTYLYLAIQSMWALFVWLMFAKFWTDYYLDVWIITNKRIIDVEQTGFFNREVATITYDKIEDVVVSVRGIIATVLKFGEIRIQSAGATREFTMHRATDPYTVKDIIFKVIEQNRIRG